MVLPIPGPPIKRSSWLLSASTHSTYCLLDRIHSHVPLALLPLVRRIFLKLSSGSVRRRDPRHLSLAPDSSLNLTTDRISIQYIHRDKDHSRRSSTTNWRASHIYLAS